MIECSFSKDDFQIIQKTPHAYQEWMKWFLPQEQGFKNKNSSSYPNTSMWWFLQFYLSFPGGMAIWLVSIWLVKSNINRGRYILASYFFKVKLVKISNGSDQLLVSFSQYKHKFCIDFQIKNGFSHQTHNLCWVAWLNTQFIWLTYLIICIMFITPLVPWE